MPRRMKPPKYGFTGGWHSHMACFGSMRDLSRVGGQHRAAAAYEGGAALPAEKIQTKGAAFYVRSTVTLVSGRRAVECCKGNDRVSSARHAQRRCDLTGL